MQAGTAASHGIGHCTDGLVLPDDALVQLVLEVEQFLPFALQHLADRDSGPFGHYFGYIVRVYLLLDHGITALGIVQSVLGVLYLIFQLLYFAIADFGHFAIVSFALGFFGLEFEVFDVGFVLLDFVHESFFTLPFGA